MPFFSLWNLVFFFSGTNTDTRHKYCSKTDFTKSALSDPVLFSSMQSTKAVLMWFSAVGVDCGATACGSGSNKGKRGEKTHTFEYSVFKMLHYESLRNTRHKWFMIIRSHNFYNHSHWSFSHMSRPFYMMATRLPGASSCWQNGLLSSRASTKIHK